MGFKKGNDPNRNMNGRGKGVGNRTTEQAKQVLLDIVNNNLDSLQKDMNKLRKEDLEAYLKLQVRMLEYIIPKLASTQTQLSGEITTKIEKIKIEIKNGTSTDNDKNME